VTTSKLVPSDSMLLVIAAEAPCPTDIMAITEPIPITIPKIVKAERDLLEEREKKVSENKSLIVIDKKSIFMIGNNHPIL